MKCYIAIHGPLRMNPNNFGDPVTLHPALSSGQNLCVQYFGFWLNPCKTTDVPSVSDVLFCAKQQMLAY